MPQRQRLNRISSNIEKYMHNNIKANVIDIPLDGQSYQVIIGENLQSSIANFTSSLTPINRKAILITDENCHGLFASSILDALHQQDFNICTIKIAPGEQSKSFLILEHALETILAFGIERKTPIIALGGGVVGDLAGLVAALAMRGVPVLQVPTTLLAQIDSSVGGKTAINSKSGKNLIGSFYQPKQVFADLTTLRSLPLRELKAGYAEALKTALIDDLEFFEWLESNHTRIINYELDALGFLIDRCVRSKARIVASDTREKGQRALLNFGHSFAHAFEGINQYTTSLLHGEAVAVGMVLAFQLSEQLGLCPAHDSMRVRSHLEKAGLPSTITEIGKYNPDILMEWMLRDKKIQDGKIVLILTRGIGQSFIATNEVHQDTLYAFLKEASQC